jgi:hypothetical protein
MLRTPSAIGVVLSLTFFAAAPAQAADPNTEVGKRPGVKPHRHALASAPHNAVPQRICSWVGPGGRAIYVCR